MTVRPDRMPDRGDAAPRSFGSWCLYVYKPKGGTPGIAFRAKWTRAKGPMRCASLDELRAYMKEQDYDKETFKGGENAWSAYRIYCKRWSNG